MSTRRCLPVLTTSCLALVGLLSIGAGSALAAAPSVTVNTPSGMTGTTVHVTGTVNPNGAPGAPATDWGIQYARASEPGAWNATAFGGEFAGAEAELKTAQPVGGTIEGLEPNTAYVLRVFAINEALEEANPIPEKPFSTLALAPTVDSESTSAVSSSTATFEALVNPNNQDTKGYLQYSTSAAVNGSGSLTAATQIPTPPGSDLGSAFGDQLLSSGALTGLPAGSTYYYQAVATNTTGTTYGVVQSFTTVPTPDTDAATAITAVTATLNGHLTLDSVDTQYSFSYKAGSECTGGNSTPAADAGSGSASAPQATSVTGLQPHTQYTVCFVTSNIFGSEQAPPVTFTTLAAAPKIENESATSIGSSNAVLQAQVNPEGADTTYHFEYGTAEGVYTTSVPTSGAEIGSSGAVNVGIQVQGLQPGTVYHFRLVAGNEIKTVVGADQTFTTQVAGAPLVLPDHRQWELVSPPNKDGAQVQEGYSSGGVARAAENGSTISYLASAPIDNEPPGNGIGTQVLSRRGTNGWSSQDISSSHEQQAGISASVGAEYQALSSDLSRAIVKPEGNIDSPSSEKSVFEYFMHEIGGGYAPLGGMFVGGTPDLSHVVDVVDRSLPGEELVEWSSGQVKPVSILPDGEKAELVDGGISEEGGVSADGTHVVWNTGFGHSGETLYDRDMRSEKTVQIDASHGGPGSGGGIFQAESADGSKVFFTSEEPLTENSTAAPGDPDLYEFVPGGGNGTLTDLTVDEHVGEHASVPVTGEEGREEGGVLGASEDGSYVYFIAHGVLAAGATSGADNLYELHEVSGAWTTKFLTSLAQADEYDWNLYTSVHSARVSPNGQFVAFMSKRSLTGYDNTVASGGSCGEDAFTEEPDPACSEVYVYDASSGKLACGSCDPTGARPLGGSSVPAWSAMRSQEAIYQPRYLSNEGRLFFDSQSPIVPQDINGQLDVYEFEPYEVGDCRTISGCVGLISGGTGPEASSFLDANASGEDVFFRTSDRLASQDTDSVFDVYDAHECTASAPCFASPSAAPSACTTADSCRTAPSPQPAVFGPPPSATFSGAGNVSPSVQGHAKVKHKTKKGRPKKKPTKKKPKEKRVRKAGKKAGKASAHAKTGRK